MTSPFPDDLLGRLSAFATSEFGLRFPPDRWQELGRGIASAALELGVSDLQGWAENLAAGALGSDERVSVANHLTISETYFFRHPDTFTVLERVILPVRIAERRKQGRPLRIWSAGCASGEESYSIAILLRQKFPELRPESAMISGTDLNTHVIGRASRGVYSEWSFRDAPSWLKEGYFERTAKGHYQIKPEIRGMVGFSPLNLAAPFYPAAFGERGDFDLILCRNVLMYFSADWQDKIIRRYTRALVEGGWLMVGPCDVTAAESAELHLHAVSPGIYQKRAAPPVKAASMPSPRFEVLEEPPAAPVKEATRRREDIRRSRAQNLSRKVDSVLAPTPEQVPASGVEALSAAARTHANRGELHEALAACDQAIGAETLNPALYHLRGCVLMEMNRFDEADAAFRRVLYLSPDSVMAEFSLASLARRAERAEEARHHYMRVLSLLSGHPRGEAVPDGEGVTVARLQEVVEQSLNETIPTNS